MACLYKRENKDGSVVYRVIFRRVGIPTFCTCFATEKKACEFVEKYESMHALEYDKFALEMLDHHITERRKRKFNL